jgi:hypothetical protein
MKYLPDLDELTPKRTSRHFIASVINTLDPTYIRDAIARNQSLIKMRQPEKETTVKIDENMLAVLKMFVAGKEHRGKSSLGLLKLNSKKRKRREVQRDTSTFMFTQEIAIDASKR